MVDCRTGVTDIGGICTIQLPDILVLLFTATDLGFSGALDVAQRAVKARQSLPFDRLKLISLPIPARFDTVTEFKNSREWLDKFSEKLKGIYSDWLPTSVNSRKFLELTKIPYVSYFSFGEKLPVIEQGVNDPTGLGYAYESISALIVNEFNYIDELMDNRDVFINRAEKDQSEIAPFLPGTKFHHKFDNRGNYLFSFGGLSGESSQYPGWSSTIAVNSKGNVIAYSIARHEWH